MAKSLLDKLVMLADAYPNFTPKDYTFALYVNALFRYGDEVIDRALWDCLNECRFFPTIAEIRERAERYEKNKLPPAEAWTMVLNAARVFGASEMPEFKDENIKAAVDKVGWSVICSKPEKESKELFISAYDSVARADTHDIKFPLLESVNKYNGG